MRVDTIVVVDGHGLATTDGIVRESSRALDELLGDGTAMDAIAILGDGDE